MDTDTFCGAMQLQYISDGVVGQTEVSLSLHGIPCIPAPGISAAGLLASAGVLRVGRRRRGRF